MDYRIGRNGYRFRICEFSSWRGGFYRCGCQPGCYPRRQFQLFANIGESFRCVWQSCWQRYRCRFLDNERNDFTRTHHYEFLGLCQCCFDEQQNTRRRESSGYIWKCYRGGYSRVLGIGSRSRCRDNQSIASCCRWCVVRYRYGANHRYAGQSDIRWCACYVLGNSRYRCWCGYSRRFSAIDCIYFRWRGDSSVQSENEERNSDSSRLYRFTSLRRRYSRIHRR